ncbi:MAG TPA: nitroreductase family protein [Pyrinomonadaceae bacterium]|nr:nitroreductase family protein [Pyrinomonadaceae bacterium]
MIEGSEVRKAGHAVGELFVDRWSPRAMSGEEISEEDLMSLFEAARWAPYSYNAQPWRLLYARRGTPHWQTFFDLMVEFNQSWAKDAAALVLFVSRETFEHNGEPSVTHSFDTGAAWQNFALQGWLKGYVVHGMQGFDYERARAALDIPEGFRVEAMAAVGRPGDSESLPEGMRARETPSGRKPLAEIVREGPFSF